MSVPARKAPEWPIRMRTPSFVPYQKRGGPLQRTVCLVLVACVITVHPTVASCHAAPPPRLVTRDDTARCVAVATQVGRTVRLAPKGRTGATVADRKAAEQRSLMGETRDGSDSVVFSGLRALIRPRLNRKHPFAACIGTAHSQQRVVEVVVPNQRPKQAASCCQTVQSFCWFATKRPRVNV